MLLLLIPRLATDLIAGLSGRRFDCVRWNFPASDAGKDAAPNHEMLAAFMRGAEPLLVEGGEVLLLLLL